jgi:hypothetical protein
MAWSRRRRERKGARRLARMWSEESGPAEAPGLTRPAPRAAANEFRPSMLRGLRGQEQPARAIVQSAEIV